MHKGLAIATRARASDGTFLDAGRELVDPPVPRFQHEVLKRHSCSVAPHTFGALRAFAVCVARVKVEGLCLSDRPAGCIELCRHRLAEHKLVRHGVPENFAQLALCARPFIHRKGAHSAVPRSHRKVRASAGHDPCRWTSGSCAWTRRARRSRRRGSSRVCTRHAHLGAARRVSGKRGAAVRCQCERCAR